MSIKTEVLFFKNLLCVKEIVRTGKMTEAAAQNGMKESNLSKTIKDVEALMNRKLFHRTSFGVVPTQEALEIACKVEQIIQNMAELQKTYFQNCGSNHVCKVYIETGFEIGDLQNLSQKIVYTDKSEDADIMICLHKPKNVKKMVCMENKIGGFVKQTLWVCARNTPETLDLASLIISRFYA